LEAIKHGFPRLGFTHEAGADLIFNVDMVRREWGEKNKDVLVRFVRAMAAAYAFVNDANNRDEVVAIVQASGSLSGDVAREILAPYPSPANSVGQNGGETGLRAINRGRARMSGVGGIRAPPPPAERFVDLQYLKAAGIQ